EPIPGDRGDDAIRPHAPHAVAAGDVQAALGPHRDGVARPALDSRRRPGAAVAGVARRPGAGHGTDDALGANPANAGIVVIDVDTAVRPEGDRPGMYHGLRGRAAVAEGTGKLTRSRDGGDDAVGTDPAHPVADARTAPRVRDVQAAVAVRGQAE